MTIFIALDVLFFLAVFTALMAVIVATFKQIIVAYYAAKSSYYTIVFKLFLDQQAESQQLGVLPSDLMASILRSFMPKPVGAKNEDES